MTRHCDMALFDDEEKRRGRCRSCISGWTHPESYPVEAPEPDRGYAEPTDGEIVAVVRVAGEPMLRLLHPSKGLALGTEAPSVRFLNRGSRAAPI
jgi:hypothetical protein